MPQHRRKSRVSTKRVYAAPEERDGYRVLVDRLWPRGLSREAAQVDLWLKDVAPSSDLRSWYDHRTEHWPHFLRRYRIEIKADANSQSAFEHLVSIVSTKENITLLFGAKESNMNNAVALKIFLEETQTSPAR